MVKKKLQVIFDDEAKLSLHKAYLFIKQDSVQNAEKVRKKILATIKELIKNPEQRSPDKYRVNNDGTYRAYEVYKYRITYHISAEEIRIIRIRHTKMGPLEY